MHIGEPLLVEIDSRPVDLHFCWSEYAPAGVRHRTSGVVRKDAAASKEWGKEDAVDFVRER